MIEIVVTDQKRFQRFMVEHGVYFTGNADQTVQYCQCSSIRSGSPFLISGNRVFWYEDQPIPDGAEILSESISNFLTREELWESMEDACYCVLSMKLGIKISAATLPGISYTFFDGDSD